MRTISVLCTTKCGTGCGHCGYDSKSKGKGMPLDVVRALKESAIRNNNQVKVTWTGGGEPLEWDDLPEAVEIMKDIPKITMSMVTSGCLDKKDPRLAILKETLKRADGHIIMTLSFNLFSKTFPQRLAFTLPYVLWKGTYEKTFIKMTNGFLMRGNRIRGYLLEEVQEEMEKALGQAVGRCAKLIEFPCEGKHFSKTITPLLQKGENIGLESWLSVKAFTTHTIYIPYNLAFLGKKIVGYGQFVDSHGRAKSILSATAENADYNFSYGFSCGALCETLDLDLDGNFVICPYEEFPPLFLGKAGDNLDEVLENKKKLAADLGMDELEIRGKSFDPCESCVCKAWELYYKQNKG